MKLMNIDIMRKSGFGKEVHNVRMGFCPFCKKLVVAEDFKDNLSRIEYSISGLCQTCQDKTFDSV